MLLASSIRLSPRLASPVLSHSRSICTVRSLDHLVLTVASLERSVVFYQKLGMRHETFTPDATPSASSAGASGDDAPRARHALRFGPSKINLHIEGHEFEPKAQTALPGTADLCFLVEEDVERVLRQLKQEGVEVLEGGVIVKRMGARGGLRSVYVRDPDGNLIELSNYEPGVE